LENKHESAGFRKKNLPQLQDRATQGRAVRDLQRKETQAAAGLRRCAFRSEKAKRFTLLPTLWIRYNVLFTIAARN
jgi:hypothetical protein